MKLLHKQSVLGLSDLDLEIHHAEIERMDQLIFSLPNVDCEVTIVYEEGYHKEKLAPQTFESNLHRYQDYLQTVDMKNGVDAFLTDEHDLAFRAYGQGYERDGQSGYLTTLMIVKCFEEGRIPMDMSRIFEIPNQEMNKDLTR